VSCSYIAVFTLFAVYICHSVWSFDYFSVDCEKQSLSPVNPPGAVVKK